MGNLFMVIAFLGLRFWEGLELVFKLKRMPTEEEIAERVGVSPERYNELGSSLTSVSNYRAITHGSFVWRVCLRMFTATFYGLQIFLAEKRGVHDVYNAAATFGLIGAPIVPPSSWILGTVNILPSSFLLVTFSLNENFKLLSIFLL